MTILTITPRAGEFINREPYGDVLREQALLASGQNLKAGTIVGKVVSGTSASAAKSGGNTGNGTFVLDATAPIQPRAIAGIYTLRCITAVVNGGVFRLEDPNGVVLGDVTITPGAGGTVTLSEHIKGVLTYGTTDFVVGDGFDITLSGLTAKYTQVAPAATDGSQIAAGILFAETNATAADTRAAFVTKHAAVTNALLTYPSSTAAQKAAMVAQLAAQHIFAI